MKSFAFFAVLFFAGMGTYASAQAADCFVNSVGDFICDSPPTDLPSNTNDSWTAPPDGGTIPPQIAKDLQDYYSGTSDDPVISPPPPPPSTPPKPPSEDDFTIAHNKGFCNAGDSVACQWLCDRGFKEYCPNSCGGVESNCVPDPNGEAITKLDVDMENGKEELHDHVIGGTADIVPSPRGDGGNAMKYELNYEFVQGTVIKGGGGDKGGTYRAESNVLNGKGDLDFGKEYWFSMDYNLADWANDKSAETAGFQVHRRPGDWSLGCGGQVSAYSNAPFLLYSQNGMTKFITRGGVVSAEWPVEQGQWKNIKVHTKITTDGDDSGFVEAWLDGKLLFRRDGPLSVKYDDCGNLMKAPYLNFGVYKWDWRNGRPPTDSSRRLLYVDNIKLIEGAAICTSTPVVCPQVGGGGGGGGGSDGRPRCAGPVPVGSGGTTLDFSSNLNTDAGLKYHLYDGANHQLTSSDSRDAGGQSILMEVGNPPLTPAQCPRNRYRSEVHPAQNGVIPWDDGKSHWVGVSYNPQEFKDTSFAIFQVHSPNEPGASQGVVGRCDYEGNPITIQPLMIDGKLQYALRVIEKGGKAIGGSATAGTATVWSTPMIEGQWADFVINFTLSSKGEGYYQAWYNGQLIYQKSGLTNVNHIDTCGNPVPEGSRQAPPPHFGIYGPACAAGSKPNHHRSILVDEIRMATGPDGYAAVDPSKGGNAVNNSCQ